MHALRCSALFTWNAISKAAFIIAILACSSARAAGPTGPGEGIDSSSFTLPAAQAAPETNFLSIDTGYAFAEGSNFFYADFYAALNGDWSRPGFFTTGYAGWGNYHYFNSAVPGGKVDAELTELSGLLGYQWVLGKVGLSASAGADWQDNSLSPKDPMNPVSGTETDFVVGAGMRVPFSERLDLKLNGGYSVVNETYSAKARIGYKFGKSLRYVIGTEGAFYGNVNQNSEGIGAFVSVPLGKRLYLNVDGGFKFVANDEFFETVETGFGTLVTEGSFGGLAGLTNGGYLGVSLSTWY
jgi:hypothetical protein